MKICYFEVIFIYTFIIILIIYNLHTSYHSQKTSKFELIKKAILN